MSEVTLTLLYDYKIMTATLVPTIKTTYTKAQLVKGFIQGWHDLFNETPSKEAIGVLFSQLAIETGLSKAMFCNNVGNVKYTINSKDPASIKYCILSGVWEIINGKRVELPPSNPGSWFRAFDSLVDGVKFHLDLLKNKRYKSAWVYIENGDIEGFATEIRAKGYYTASLADYVKGMNSFFKPYMKDTYYEEAIKELNLASKEPEMPLNDADKQNKAPESNTNESVLKDKVEPKKELVVQGWQGKLFNVLKNLPWIKIIEWLAKLFKK